MEYYVEVSRLPTFELCYPVFIPPILIYIFLKTCLSCFIMSALPLGSGYFTQVPLSHASHWHLLSCSLLSPDLRSSLNLGVPTFIVVQNYVLGGFLVMIVKVRDRRTRGRWQGIPSLTLISLLEAGLFPGCSLRYKTFFLSPETLAVVLSLPRQFACLVTSKCYCVISAMYLLSWILTVRSQYFIMVRM